MVDEYADEEGPMPDEYWPLPPGKSGLHHDDDQAFEQLDREFWEKAAEEEWQRQQENAFWRGFVEQEQRKEEIKAELRRISRPDAMDVCWDFCLLDDQFMTMRHKSDANERFTYYREAVTFHDALSALKALPDGYGIDRAVIDILFRLPARLSHDQSERLIIAFTKREEKRAWCHAFA